MTKPTKRGTRRQQLIAAEVSSTARHPDEAREVLWAIALDPEQSGTARVSACRILLMEARTCEGVEARHGADLNRRALELMRRAQN